MLYGVGIDERLVRGWGDNLGCSVGSIPFRYLGLPVGANPKFKSVWDPVIESLRNRLAKWKTKFISRAGRVVLLKSVLNSLPLYFMSLFKVPVCVLEEIEKIRRSFFWGKDPCQRKLCIMDSAYLQQFRAKLRYLQFGRRLQIFFHPSSPSGVVAKKGLLHCVGKGDCTRFLDDHWVEGHILNTSFPRIFALAANKSGLFCDFGMWENGQWKWNVKLRRNIFDWEVEQFDSFMLILNSVVMMATRNDKVVWSFDTLGKFSSRSFGKEIGKSSYSDPILHAIWKFKAPPKARLLCWQSIVRKLPTRDMLLRIGVIAENQSGCPLLGYSKKYESPIFLVDGYGHMAKVVKYKEVWQTTFFADVWHVWEARNKAIFADTKSSYWQVLDLVKFRTGCWVKAFSRASPYSLLDFHVNLFSITTCGSTMEKNDHNQQWRPPDVGSLKFNVDGAARGKPGPAGIGGLLRNNCGAVVAMFSIPIGVLDSNVAEVMAIKEACRMVNEKLDLSSSGIIVESDSLNAVSWVRHPLERPWRLLSHFQEIDLFLSTNGNRSIAHIKREGNCDADKLAKEGVIHSVPLSIWNL
ncbi:hypothetical protein CTI12_AA301610 [Artemisia annua]|uniref:RNase H type-1 domain-containing protein n=1 Tax=Artemisia annua TaxID=35608 RepID=A0A2U1N5J9_ARTAN|nr:hypothetical protein CTI12_AA301610 [Artemisia annua]